ncbi:cytochrome c oxidase assembly protein [Pseudonocardia dioxanivorans]|uniref:cytochrome c oxidase assembly protein n=1 Tax=Pseudonocardia dioxanivorans TaxID=240495 RepID=UPI000CD18A9F|nr:cytochrome c oxidase assembly protein [Pseudonocardia dioxanivorans]
MITALVAAADIPAAPLGWDNAFSTWTVPWWQLAVLTVAGAAYLVGVATLRRKGIPWQRGRIVLWFVGLAMIGLSAASAIGVYDRASFAMSAVQHMVLQMIAPAPLGLAAPVTLALRATTGRPRRTLLRLLHSRYIAVVTHPLVAYALFVVTPFVLIYSSLFDIGLTDDVVHDLTHVHFVLVGALLYWPLLGVDPLPNPLPFVMRLLLVVGLGPAHIVLGIPIMLRDSLLAPGFFLDVAARWGNDALADQKAGGGLLWIFGDVVVLFLLGGLFSQWNRSEKREQRRIDRHLDRLHGDAATTPPWWLTSETTPATDTTDQKELDPR